VDAVTGNGISTSTMKQVVDEQAMDGGAPVRNGVTTTRHLDESRE